MEAMLVIRNLADAQMQNARLVGLERRSATKVRFTFCVLILSKIPLKGGTKIVVQSWEVSLFFEGMLFQNNGQKYVLSM